MIDYWNWFFSSRSLSSRRRFAVAILTTAPSAIFSLLTASTCLRPVSGRFTIIHYVSPVSAGLAQLLFLEYALPMSEYPDLAPHCLPRQRYRHPLKRIRCIRSAYMTAGKNYPLSELWSLRNFGRKIGRKEPPRAQLTWSLSGDELDIDGGRITMSDFRGWIQSHIRRTLRSPSVSLTWLFTDG